MVLKKEPEKFFKKIKFEWSIIFIFIFISINI